MSQDNDIRNMEAQTDDYDVSTSTRRSSSNQTHDILATLDGFDSEDDNDIELELTIQYMANGESDMRVNDYATAEENFRSALELAEEHDFSRKLDYGPGDITLVLADCLMNQEKEEEALELLEPIADGAMGLHNSDVASVRAGSIMDGGRDQITQFKACHTLATIFLRREDHHAAEKRAQQAFKGRRKLCGAQDPSTIESVQLLIDIYTSKDDKTKARAYRRFLEPAAKARPSIGGSTVPVPQPEAPAQSLSPHPATATITSPVPTTLEGTDTTTSASMVPAALQTRKQPQSPPQVTHPAPVMAPTSAYSPPSEPLPQIKENESLSVASPVLSSSNGSTSSPLPETIRAAVQSASSPSTIPPAPSNDSIHSNVISSKDTAPQSASKAALASIFASTESRPSKKVEEPSSFSAAPPLDVDPVASTKAAAIAQPHYAAQIPIPVAPAVELPPEPIRTTQIQTPITPAAVSLPEPVRPDVPPAPAKTTHSQTTFVPPPSSNTSSTPQLSAEIPLSVPPPQEQLTAPPRSFSWLTDTKLSVPSSTAKAISPPPANPRPSNVSSRPAQPDAPPPKASSTVTTSTTSSKKKGWGLSFSRSKTDATTKRPSASGPVPGSAATTYTATRNPSVTTLQSNAEPKRLMSLSGSISSAPLSFLSKEYSNGEKSPRNSISSRSYSTSTHPPARSYQELAPKFAAIKTLRAEGKKSASIDAAMKLLREYDPDKKVLMIREAELKKNMKEGHKGLASTGHGYAPIHLFCDRKIEAAAEVEILIEQSVDVNAVACKAGMPGHDPFTPLQRAVEHGHAEIVRLLIEADATIGSPRPQKGSAGAGNKDAITEPLLIACTRGFTEITFVLLRAGAAKALKEFPSRQWHGNSLLHEACWLADTRMVKMLLDHLKTIKAQYHSSAGPDYESGVVGAPGQQDQFGATPIMYAIDLRDCTSDRMRSQKSHRRKDCLRLLLEHDIHGDLHSQAYRENIARVLTTKWTRGPGKGHSIFCYCDEAGDEELTRLLDPFRYQVAPNMRCHATPQCSSFQGSSIRNGSVRSGATATDRQAHMPEFAELMSAPVAWPSATSPTSPTGAGAHFELADNSDPPPSFESATGENRRSMGGGSATTGRSAPMSPVTNASTSHGYARHVHGVSGGISELNGETR